jgi:acetyl esterase/lipase
MVAAKLDPAHSSQTVAERRIHDHRGARSVAVSLASRFIVKNAVRVWAVQPNLQWPFQSVDRFAGMLPHWSSAKIERVRLHNCRAEWVQTAKRPAARAILYLHGGAFLTCGLNTHRSLVT